MMTWLVTYFIKIDFFHFIGLIYISGFLIIALFILIISFHIYKNKIEINKDQWQQSVAGLISQAIFFTKENDDKLDITYKIEMLLKKYHFRKYIGKEIIHAKKNISGSSWDNMKTLYEILQLNNDSAIRLQHKRSHIKARAIYQLAIMQQTTYVKEIFRLTNHINKMVRNEAQCAMVSFYGFTGLRFLNVTKYPISLWQQIQLLSKLGDAKPDDTGSIKNWLVSANDSVVMFALKLAAKYNCFDLYENCVPCLHHVNVEVRLAALKYLKKMPQENTGEQIVKSYTAIDKKYRLAVIDALNDTAGEGQINFLLKQLHDNDNDIKSCAAKALAYIHPAGKNFLQTHLFADEYPWSAIFYTIENDRAA